MLRPLHDRDFALLTGGSTISLLGDGFFFVALAWQVYEISNAPTASNVHSAVRLVISPLVARRIRSGLL